MFDLVTKCKAVVHYMHFESSLRKVAAVHGVSKSTVGRWINKPNPATTVKRQRKSLIKQVAPSIACMIKTNPYLTCCEICSRLEHDTGIKISKATAHRALKSCDLSYKLAMRSYEDHPKDMTHAFYHTEDVYQNTISIDETCFYYNDMPRRGWGLRGKRVPKRHPTKRTKISLLLAMDRDGVVASEIIRGNFNSISFASFIRKLPCNRRLIMDNVSFHKSNIVKEAMADRNLTVTYIPPYNPWYNPVEYAFAVVKNDFRKRRSKSQNLETFEADVLASVAVLGNNMCTAFFEHSKRLWQEDRSRKEV